MAEKDKKYYWLRIKRDFFKRHDIQIIEDMPNGKDYILFYLKLLCESVDHEGELRFSEEIPYNEQMLATITRTNIDTVRSAIKVFEQLKMLEVLDNGTYYMKELPKMLGSETYWAKKKREERVGHLLDSVGQCPTCPSKRIEIDIDIDKRGENIEREKGQMPPPPPLKELKGDIYEYEPVDFEENPPKGNKAEAFFKKHTNVIRDTYSGKIAEVDFDKLDEAFQKSRYLRGKKQKLSFILANYISIIGGYYEDFDKTKTAVEVEKETAAVKQSRQSEQFRIEDKVEANAEIAKTYKRLRQLEIEIARAEMRGDEYEQESLENEKAMLEDVMINFLGEEDYKKLIRK